MLLQTANKVAADFPSVKVGALCADFLGKFEMPEQVGGSNGGQLVFFPGSTIGNLTPLDAGKFLGQVRNLIGENGSILIGVDLRKDKIILNEAYNDVAGYTAAFNLNILHRIKNELNAEIDIASFRHLAFFNEEKSRIEMHLMSERFQTIVLDGSTFKIEKEETIHTENSYKYSLEDFAHLASDSGYLVFKSWIDKNNLFSIQYLVPC
jgi:dimethylhistidine N-methyltransferase